MHSMPFEPAIPAIKQIHAYAVDHMAVGIGRKSCVHCDCHLFTGLLNILAKRWSCGMSHRAKWSVMMMMMMMTTTTIWESFENSAAICDSRRHIPEDLDSLATPLRQPEILQNFAALKFQFVRETVRGDPMAGETGYWLLCRGNGKSRPGIWYMPPLVGEAMWKSSGLAVQWNGWTESCRTISNGFILHFIQLRKWENFE